ncbi:hypothetical protein [Microbacterium sp. A93]|uniref:hypothetical protein n=1 Tax=Microbacterium sp. A93 TaxID=3450716 RepID=UPI003F43F98C
MVSDAVIEWIDSNVSIDEQLQVLEDIVAICRVPWGKHTLSNRGGQKLAGFNTAESVDRTYRIVFRSSITNSGTELVEVVAVGHRHDNLVYDVANALVASGVLTDAEVQQIWEMLELLDGAMATVTGLGQWDYIPGPAPAGLQQATVASGLLDERVAKLLTTDEITAAMSAGWDPDTGEHRPEWALEAALHRLTSSADPDRFLALRGEPRCGAPMKIAKAPCIRPRGHAGAHRAHVR